VNSVVIAVFLVVVALTDGALAGFRAAAGRSARIRKARYNLIAGARGAAPCAAVLLGIAAGLGWYLGTRANQAAAFGALVAAGTRMSLVYLPYAAIVLTSLAGYFTLPLRASSWIILVGLGPLTLLRPAVAIAGGIAASWPSHGVAVPLTTVAAVAGVLAIEPAVHHHWYREVQAPQPEAAFGR
jgi:hypothetical protein